MDDATVMQRVQIGMTAADVESVLGDHHDDSDGGWIYQNIPPENHPEASTRIFVIFDDGIVSKVFFAKPRHHSSRRLE